MFAMFAIAHLSHIQASNALLERSNAPRLVLYVFSNTDAEYMKNLIFFAREGMVEDTFTDYVIVINSNEPLVLPKLKVNNARYIYHKNECFDFGTFGYVIHGMERIKKYKYYIFMNSSVRGPFLPAYVRGKIRWEDLFISRLTNEVKLVGPTINCEGAAKEDSREWRANPHVQSYAMATDAVGLDLMLRANVFSCYNTISDTVFHAELGSSKAILDAGYEIDSFMTRYQGVKWSDKKNWGCNRNVNPYGAHMNDGVTLEAMEVMFVKVKEHLMDRVPYMQTAAAYDRWYTAKDTRNNDFVVKRATYNIPKLLVGMRRGLRCFDCRFYKNANRDLPKAWTCRQAYEHYINDGDIEGRKARFLCPMKAIGRQVYNPRKGEEQLAAAVR